MSDPFPKTPVVYYLNNGGYILKVPEGFKFKIVNLNTLSYHQIHKSPRNAPAQELSRGVLRNTINTIIQPTIKRLSP